MSRKAALAVMMRPRVGHDEAVGGVLDQLEQLRFQLRHADVRGDRRRGGGDADEKELAGSWRNSEAKTRTSTGRCRAMRPARRRPARRRARRRAGPARPGGCAASNDLGKGAADQPLAGLAEQPAGRRVASVIRWVRRRASTPARPTSRTAAGSASRHGAAGSSRAPPTAGHPPDAAAGGDRRAGRGRTRPRGRSAPTAYGGEQQGHRFAAGAAVVDMAPLGAARRRHRAAGCPPWRGSPVSRCRPSACRTSFCCPRVRGRARRSGTRCRGSRHRRPESGRHPRPR